jgi:hypothetical protein
VGLSGFSSVLSSACRRKAARLRSSWGLSVCCQRTVSCSQKPSGTGNGTRKADVSCPLVFGYQDWFRLRLEPREVALTRGTRLR